MFLGDDVTLFYYLPRNAFLDKKSKEEATSVIKPKYKLLFKRHKELDIFLFFILTTKQSSCVKERTFCIDEKDWDERVEGRLLANKSYIDVQKYITLSKEEVLSKAENSREGFSYAGKISQTSFTNLNSVTNKYTSSATNKTDFKARDMLKDLISDIEPNIFLKKFKI